MLVEERMPWPPRTAAAALVFVGGVWTAGFALLLVGSPLGVLAVALAAWLTVGLVYTALRAPGRSSS